MKIVEEFARILKVGDTLRMLVPDLKKAVLTYANQDESYFSSSRHYSDHLKIGGAVVRTLILPDSQTPVISREMDEVLGSYTHLDIFDFDMLRPLLEKWDFIEVCETSPDESAIAELRKLQHLVCDDKAYDLDDDFVTWKEFLKRPGNWQIAGFDKSTRKSLCVEAKKAREEPYSHDKEFAYNKNSHFGGRRDRVKLIFIRLIVQGLDGLCGVLRVPGIVTLFRT